MSQVLEYAPASLCVVMCIRLSASGAALRLGFGPVETYVRIHDQVTGQLQEPGAHISVQVYSVRA
eukprot:1177244-Prorocentrum_minimum.AAC.2